MTLNVITYSMVGSCCRIEIICIRWCHCLMTERQTHSLAHGARILLGGVRQRVDTDSSHRQDSDTL